MKLKKIIVIILSIGIILSNNVSTVFASTNMEDELTVILNGEVIEFDVQPTVIEGRTLVPVRAIFEGLGLFVHWEGDTQTVYGWGKGNKIALQLGAVEAYANGTQYVLDQPAQAINGRTLVPLRFVAESLGCDVQWHGETKTIVIDKAFIYEEPVEYVDLASICTDEIYIDDYDYRNTKNGLVYDYGRVDRNHSYITIKYETKYIDFQEVEVFITHNNDFETWKKKFDHRVVNDDMEMSIEVVNYFYSLIDEHKEAFEKHQLILEGADENKAVYFAKLETVRKTIIQEEMDMAQLYIGDEVADSDNTNIDEDRDIYVELFGESDTSTIRQRLFDALYDLSLLANIPEAYFIDSVDQIVKEIEASIKESIDESLSDLEEETGTFTNTEAEIRSELTWLEEEIPNHTMKGSDIRWMYIDYYSDLMRQLGATEEEIEAKREELHNAYDEDYYNWCIENGVEPK